jgi:hypothetical protein
MRNTVILNILLHVKSESDEIQGNKIRVLQNYSLFEFGIKRGVLDTVRECQLFKDCVTDNYRYFSNRGRNISH